jgi:glutamate/tyrosine decarboxylase-like PLP-dependent enzyme
MDPEQLKRKIREDIQSGYAPVMVVATAGSTGTGSIDDLVKMGLICQEYGIWYHVDAAYGGACVVHPEMRQWLTGIEMSHSLIVDLHKWFSVPMAASMFITRDPAILHRTFRINTAYMPKDAGKMKITDPFAHSFQWSRRFSGLKVYLSMLMYGMTGYSEVIHRQVEVADVLRHQLVQHGWSIKNETSLPVVCFTDDGFTDLPEFARNVCQDVVKSGKAWVSVYPVADQEVLRACITNYNTDETHIVELVKLLNRYRDNYRKGLLHKQ